MTGYVCKYTPIEILAAFGETPSFILPEEPSYDYADSRLWPSVCSYAKAVLEHVHAGAYGSVVFTDCCDAMKRVHDVLATDATNPSFADLRFGCDSPSARSFGESTCGSPRPFMIGLPRVITDASVRAYADNLRRFVAEYGAYSGKPFDERKFREACGARTAPKPQSDYVAVLGARAPRTLIEAARSLCTLPVRDLTCGSGERDFSAVADSAEDDLLLNYARALLTQTPCMRMNDNGARAALFEDPHLRAIVYHTIQFCDFYGFEHAGSPKHIPALKLETDYTPSASGQLATRLQAFFEAGGILSMGGQAAGRDPASRRLYAGVDCGSTTTNAVIIDADGVIRAAVTLPTGADGSAVARQALDEALTLAPDGTDGRAPVRGAEDLAAIVATGYGRAAVPFAARDVTEITCHARGAHVLAPAARTIIDIGGQDSKVIRLDADGNVTEFSMNDKCAAGTGRFLELMADTLGMDPDAMAAAGLMPDETIDISSMCAVFAESEVVSLIADGKRAGDIVWGIDLAIAGRVAAMAARLGAEPPYVMTGGVARNAGVVRALGVKLAEYKGMAGSAARAQEPIVPPDPQICGAYGAALIARDGAA
jgi:predicted CoA-substrate-specific enzyme activase